MKLGVVFGYWGAGPAPASSKRRRRPSASATTRCGSRSRGATTRSRSPRGSPRNTATIKIGTGIVQIAARTPTATAMAAVTLDHLSNGRLILGLGVSGPQVVEGWYGQPSNRPLARTREYVEIIRRVLRREGPLEFDGEFYPLPYRGAGSAGSASRSRS